MSKLKVKAYILPQDNEYADEKRIILSFNVSFFTLVHNRKEMKYLDSSFPQLNLFH